MIKRVLITGANKGIGLATVTAVLAARDDTHVLLGSRDPERGKRAREGIIADQPAYAERIEALAIDVSDDASVAAARDTVVGQFGQQPEPLFGIINNAGIGLGGQTMASVLEVNTRGPRRVCEAFVPLLDQQHGRVVNVSSAAGPTFVSKCSPARQQLLTSPAISWQDIEALMAECLAIEAAGGSFSAAGLSDGSAYGLSKACLNGYTSELARRYPQLIINACTPGFIETDLTQAYTQAAGKSGREMGMKSPAEGTQASLHLLLGDPGGSGWYFGSDAVRSPIDRYRSPGDPPYTGT